MLQSLTMMKKKSLKSIFATTIASCLEWYEYSLYAYFANIIGLLFFPQHSPSLNMIYAYAVFAVGFVCRPFGSILFGMLGDIKGRRFSLALSLFVMGIATTLFAFMPTYEQVGILAPIGLIILRLVQGIAVGGNYGGAFVFAVEHAPEGRKGLAGSFTAFGVLGGLILGSLVSTIANSVLSTEELYSWGWRLPYLFSITATILAYYIHTHIDETPEFKILEKLNLKTKIPVIDIIKHHKGKIVQAVSILLLDAVGVYTLFIFFNTYMTHYLHLSSATALTINTVNMCIMVVFIPIFGYLSDKINPRTIIIGAALGFILLSYPLFYCIQSGDVTTIFLSQSLFAVIMGACYGSLPSNIPMMFHKNIRYTASSVVFNISTAFFGGSTPLLLTLLINNTDNLMSPAYVLITIGCIALLAVITVPQTTRGCK